MNTRIYKDDITKSWKAETNIDISNDRVINITTSKRFDLLQTIVSVSKRVDGVLKHVYRVDYNKVERSSTHVRYTKNVVLAQHNHILDMMDIITCNIIKFYIIKFYEELDSNKA